MRKTKLNKSYNMMLIKDPDATSIYQEDLIEEESLSHLDLVKTYHKDLKEGYRYYRHQNLIERLNLKLERTLNHTSLFIRGNLAYQSELEDIYIKTIHELNIEKSILNYIKLAINQIKNNDNIKPADLYLIFQIIRQSSFERINRYNLELIQLAFKLQDHSCEIASEYFYGESYLYECENHLLSLIKQKR